MCFLIIINELLSQRYCFVISDIHGNLDLYLKLLDQISYKPNEDCLILLGDLIEKGKRNLDTLHYIMHQVQNEDVHCIMGNC